MPLVVGCFRLAAGRGSTLIAGGQTPRAGAVLKVKDKKANRLTAVDANMRQPRECQ